MKRTLVLVLVGGIVAAVVQPFTPTGWWLNSGRGVAITSAVLALTAVVVGLRARALGSRVVAAAGALWFGANIGFWNQPSLLGIGVSFLIAGVAAFRLMLDFDFIENAVAAGAPKYLEWYSGFGLMVGLVWLYLELLRLISLLRQR